MQLDTLQKEFLTSSFVFGLITPLVKLVLVTFVLYKWTMFLTMQICCYCLSLSCLHYRCDTLLC